MLCPCKSGTHTKNLQLENKFDDYIQQTILLHVLIQEFAVKIIPDCVIDEPLGSLELSSCLVLEDNIIIPSAMTHGQWALQHTAYLCTPR